MYNSCNLKSMNGKYLSDINKLKKNSSRLLLKQLIYLTSEQRMELFCYVYAVLEIFKENDNPNKLLVKQILSDIDSIEQYPSNIIKELFVDIISCVNTNKESINNKELVKTILMYEIYAL